MRKSTPTKQRVGSVCVKPLSPGRFVLQWRDPETGSYVRRRVSCSRQEAEEAALSISVEVRAGRGFIPGKASKRTPTVSDAIESAIRNSGGNDITREDLGKRAAPFVRWLNERYPRVQEWADLKPGMIREYVSELSKAGRAYDTIRMRLVPIKMAWARMAEDYPSVIHTLPKIRIPHRGPAKIESLDAFEVEVLLHWLKRAAPNLYPVALLMGLCGLRTREAVHLRRCDIDLEKGLVHIRETAAHRPKNRPSHRSIPVPGEVIEALRESIQGQRVIPLGEAGIFRTKYGASWESNTLTVRFSNLLSDCSEETGLPVFRRIPIRKLRSSFASMAFGLGVDPSLIRPYMGHAGGILEQHYMKVGVEELRLVSDRMEDWRDLLSKGRDCKNIATPKQAGAVTA